MQDGSTSFRTLCAEHGIAVTHQRQVLYETMQSMHGHPSPEEVYASVKQRIPSISLATVYKNIHLFVQSGVLRELSMHHGTLRVEMNKEPHHHLVCSVCKTVTDVDDAELGVGLMRSDDGSKRLSDGFVVERVSVDAIGICAACQAMPSQSFVGQLRPN